MRLTALWLMCSLSYGADLEALRHEHRWFDLREALKTQKGSALDRLPDQSLVSPGISRVQGQIRESALFAPVSINGKKAKAQLDTDANMSLMSQSEAQRLGLKIGGAATLGGASEGKGQGKIGTAEHFEIGGLRLRDVAFAIVSDEQQPFKDLPPGERIVLGIPVILAMGGLRWSHDGTIEIGSRVADRVDPNLCFDKADPIVRVESLGRSLEMLFDTGSNETLLWPRFLRDFPGMAAAAKKDSNTITGITGSTEVETLDLDEIKLRVHGADVIVRPARLLMKSTMKPSEWTHGWLGFDSMERGGAVDFRTMIVTIE